MAGAIAEVARQTLAPDFRRIDPRTARILLIEAGPRILPALPERLSAYAEKSAETDGRRGSHFEPRDELRSPRRRGGRAHHAVGNHHLGGRRGCLTGRGVDGRGKRQGGPRAGQPGPVGAGLGERVRHRRCGSSTTPRTRSFPGSPPPQSRWAGTRRDHRQPCARVIRSWSIPLPPSGRSRDHRQARRSRES